MITSSLSEFLFLYTSEYVCLSIAHPSGTAVENGDWAAILFLQTDKEQVSQAPPKPSLWENNYLVYLLDNYYSLF